jgi:hypothetical protein
MKIPGGDRPRDKARRFDYFINLKERCLVSRTERRENYTSNRFFWLYGSDGSYENEDVDTGLGPPPGNKIYPHLDQLTSFLYAQETTRFAIDIEAHVHDDFQKWVPKLNDYVNDEWHTSNTDIVFGLALLYSLVYGSTFIKPVWKKDGIYPGIILPHNVGFLREDTMQVSKQEAFVHLYTITEGQFVDDYSFLPNFEQIRRRIAKRAEGIADSQEAGIDRIIMSSQDPLSAGAGGTGIVDWLAQISMNYVPRVREELIEMCELTVYDDELKDYRLITIADPDVLLLDRPLTRTGWLDHEPPLIQVCPNPDPNYIYGIAEVERLMPLQVYRNKCMAQIDHLQELQAHPPSTSSGFPSDLLEMQYVLDSPNGFLNQPDPSNMGGGASVKAERVKIEIPTDLYARIDKIDEMFELMSGLPPITQGKNQPGVRAGGHAAELAKLGSSRARKRALIVEDALEKLATVYLKILRKYDDKHLRNYVGEEFVAAQFTDNFIVKVDAHSNSPIFVDDNTQLAFNLLKAKCITRERFLSMINVANRRQLIYDLKNVIEPEEQKQAQMQQQLLAARAQQGGGRPKGANGAPPQPPAAQ